MVFRGVSPGSTISSKLNFKSEAEAIGKGGALILFSPASLQPKQHYTQLLPSLRLLKCFDFPSFSLRCLALCFQCAATAGITNVTRM